MRSSRSWTTGRRTARLLNNLAGLNHLLGSPERAVTLLEEAFQSFVELDLPVDAGYVCSSLAEIRLDLGDAELAETQARKALDLLGGRADHVQEIGTAQLALGRSLAAQGRLDEAEKLARPRRGDVRAGELGEPRELGVARAGRPREPTRQRRASRPVSTAALRALSRKSEL